MERWEMGGRGTRLVNYYQGQSRYDSKVEGGGGRWIVRDEERKDESIALCTTPPLPRLAHVPLEKEIEKHNIYHRFFPSLLQLLLFLSVFLSFLFEGLIANLESTMSDGIELVSQPGSNALTENKHSSNEQPAASIASSESPSSSRGRVRLAAILLALSVGAGR